MVVGPSAELVESGGDGAHGLRHLGVHSIGVGVIVVIVVELAGQDGEGCPQRGVHRDELPRHVIGIP